MVVVVVVVVASVVDSVAGGEYFFLGVEGGSLLISLVGSVVWSGMLVKKLLPNEVVPLV